DFPNAGLIVGREVELEVELAGDGGVVAAEFGFDAGGVKNAHPNRDDGVDGFAGGVDGDLNGGGAVLGRGFGGGDGDGIDRFFGDHEDAAFAGTELEWDLDR